MSAAYCRMVVRVHPELPERLTTIQTHLFDETRIEYSRAAIMRGLINLGLTQVEGAPNLAVLFIGSRVKRGRKPGGKVATAVVPLDLSDEPDDEIDLEFDDDHHDALRPREVVARQRIRRRRPLQDATLLGPRREQSDDEDDEEEDEDEDPEDEDTDPGMDLDDDDTADEEPDGL